jgi:hypothetical protein
LVWVHLVQRERVKMSRARFIFAKFFLEDVPRYYCTYWYSILYLVVYSTTTVLIRWCALAFDITV